MSLLLNSLIQFPLFDTVIPEAPTGNLNKEDIIDVLDKEDDTDVIPLEDKDKKKEEKKVETKDEDEDDEIEDEDDEDELKELEEELEEPTEDQLELVTPVRRREILKKFPTLFKEFPYLEKAYYREQQFTELLPTIDDAKEAVKAKETLDNFENDLMGGNTETILKAIKNENPRAFNKVVDDYMTTLAKVDEKAYHHVIGNTIKYVISGMVVEGRRSNNEALQTAAQLLNQFVFGSSEFEQPKKLSTDSGPDPKDDELSKREQAFIKKQLETTNNDLNTRVNNALKNTIDANIDPKQSMTDYVRRNASREALEELETLINKDSRFKSLVDKLWEKAAKDNFSKDSVDRIRSAYTSKAKTLLPSVIKKARNEALKGMGKRVASEEDEEKSPKKGPVTPGKPSSQSKGGKINKAEDIPRGMNTLDFLSQD